MCVGVCTETVCLQWLFNYASASGVSITTYIKWATQYMHVYLMCIYRHWTLHTCMLTGTNVTYVHVHVCVFEVHIRYNVNVAYTLLRVLWQCVTHYNHTQSRDIWTAVYFSSSTRFPTLKGKFVHMHVVYLLCSVYAVFMVTLAAQWTHVSMQAQSLCGQGGREGGSWRRKRGARTAK